MYNVSTYIGISGYKHVHVHIISVLLNKLLEDISGSDHFGVCLHIHVIIMLEWIQACACMIIIISSLLS